MVLQLSLACHQMKHFCFELCSVQLWFIQYLDPLDYVNFGLIWYMTVLTTSNYTCTSYIYLWLISVKLFAFQTNVININAPVPRCSGSSYSWISWIVPGSQLPVVSNIVLGCSYTCTSTIWQWRILLHR